jgi:EF-P beta-lysylation protein EpmB
MRDASVTWQKILAQGFSSSKELLEFLDLPQSLGYAAAERPFKMRVPRGFAARMQPKNPFDPLLLQVLAVKEELAEQNDYLFDPLSEAKTNVMQGLIHKYHGRVLLTLTGACAINCRYCFRRHFPYQNNNPGRDGWSVVLDYIKQDDSIHEVILSGGDPLLASDSLFQELLPQIAAIAHIRTLRIHTRIPIVLPERINEPLLSLLANLPLRKVIVLHCNHAQEINDEVRNVCKALRLANCHLLNQTVLLKGINNDVTTLTNLSDALFDCGVLPYYLHLLDKVVGAAHFDIPLAEALQLYRALQHTLPGYLLPKLAREEAGQKSKTLLI